MWQKCPVCNGLGTIPSEFTAARTTCIVCQGARIISELTGLPPKQRAASKEIFPQKTEKK